MSVRAGERACVQWMSWKFINLSGEMGRQEDSLELRGCKFMFPLQVPSRTCSSHCPGVGLCLCQGLNWLISYKKTLAFCTVDLYHHKSSIGEDARLISCLASPAHLLQAQAVEEGPYFSVTCNLNAETRISSGVHLKKKNSRLSVQSLTSMFSISLSPNSLVRLSKLLYCGTQDF